MEPDNQTIEKINFPPCPADKELEYLIRAKYTLIYVVTWEEGRVIDSLSNICNLENINIGGVQVWDAARGLWGYNEEKGAYIPIPGGEALLAPEQILDHVIKRAEETKERHLKAKAARGPIFVLCDFFRFLGSEGLTPEVERKMRNLPLLLKKTANMSVIITSPELQLPTALEKSMAIVDYPLPGKEQLEVLVKTAKNALHHMKKSMTKDQFDSPNEEVVRALLGLTLTEAEDALSKAWVMTRSLDIKIILDFKRQIIRKGQLLDYIYANSNLDDVGGFKGVKEFISLRKRAFGEKAEAYGLPAPKGIFLLGVQGSGKSLCAKAIANELNVPLLKLDMGRMFGSLMGQSEAQMSRAIQLAESVAPCVLFVDEIDKALSGVTGATTDSGTTKRVIGKLIDWMQEKESPVFIVACANSLSGLPPELLRKGRFDELFFVNLPNEEERQSIFEIHLRKRKRDPSKFKLTELVAQTAEFSGAEIEGVIVDAMFNAFGDDARELDARDIKKAIEVCVPLSKVMKEQIDELRESARGRMRGASQSLKDRVDHPALINRFEGLENTTS